MHRCHQPSVQTGMFGLVCCPSGWQHPPAPGGQQGQAGDGEAAVLMRGQPQHTHTGANHLPHTSTTPPSRLALPSRGWCAKVLVLWQFQVLLISQVHQACRPQQGPAGPPALAGFCFSMRCLHCWVDTASPPLAALFSQQGETVTRHCKLPCYPVLGLQSSGLWPGHRHSCSALCVCSNARACCADGCGCFPQVGMSVLHKAAEAGFLEVVEALLNMGADVEATDYVRALPLAALGHGLCCRVPCSVHTQALWSAAACPQCPPGHSANALQVPGLMQH